MLRKNTLYSLAMCIWAAIGASCWGQSHTEQSVLSHGYWVQLSINQSGIYRLDASDIPALSNCEIDKIGLYGQRGGSLPSENWKERPDDLKQMAIDIHDANGNGRMDAGDYLLFYAEGADHWNFDNEVHKFIRDHHVYALQNYCYLTTDETQPRRIVQTSTVSSPTDEVHTYTALAYHEVDQYNVANGGQRWMGEKMVTGNTHCEITMAIPTRSSATVQVRYALASVTSASSFFTIASGSTSRQLHFSPTSHYQTDDDNFSLPTTGSISFSLDYQPQESGASGYVDYIEVNATAALSFSSGMVDFRSITPRDSLSVLQYTIAQATQAMRVWDITDYHTASEMNLSLVGSNATFSQAESSLHEYIAFDGSTYLSPTSVEELSNQNIHGTETPDLVIVTHPDYRSQSEQIAALHRIEDNLEVLVVTDKEVYNEFSSGKQDPIAIREMLRMFYQRSNGEKPRYLMLFGKGSYDPKDLLGNDQSTIVTGLSEQSFEDSESTFATDNIFGFLGDNEIGLGTSESLEVGIGRLPVHDTEEANLMVQKISDYMHRSDLQADDVRGDWRNYVCLLADDADPSTNDEYFVTSAENNAREIQSAHPLFNLDKIYADSYHQQNGAIGSYYPDVNNALKQRIDYGCLLLNYIGHGSTEYIGTEQYMTKTDISSYSNSGRLCFFVASTCSFGRYDNPSLISGAEAFLLSPAAGIGVLSAGRAISHSDPFNSEICRLALTKGYCLGDAVREAKNHIHVSQCVTLFGDPALQLSLPQEEVVVTSINGHPVDSDVCDSAEVLSEVTIEGEIRLPEGGVATDFTGVIYPIVFDRETQCQTLGNDNEGSTVSFTQQKSILYKGCDSVREGQFRYSFIVPRDVAYTFGGGRLSHYAKSGSDDAAGVYQNILFGGFNEDADLSEIRPTIRLYMNDSSFRSGGTTNENPMIYAILEDSVGINAVGSGIGHDITALLDEDYNSLLTLNDFYETDITDGRRGYLRYYLNDLQPGQHTLTLKAWNIYNYSNSATINFVVAESSEALYSLNIAPNPARDHVAIRVEHNAADSLQSVQVDIFDRCGRHVKQFTPTVAPQSFVAGPIIWDLHSDSGMRIIPGVYIVRALLTNTNQEKTAINSKIVVIGQ